MIAVTLQSYNYANRDWRDVMREIYALTYAGECQIRRITDIEWRVCRSQSGYPYMTHCNNIINASVVHLAVYLALPLSHKHSNLCAIFDNLLNTNILRISACQRIRVSRAKLGNTILRRKLLKRELGSIFTSTFRAGDTRRYNCI